MSEHRPLTAEERVRIGDANKTTDIRTLLVLLLRAIESEAYWREAVKNTPGINNDYCCHFCELEEDHKPNCPWLLAQEE